MISTGIEDLDKALLGGYGEAKSIAIIGDSSHEKEYFVYAFLSKNKGICVAIDYSPEEIIKKASEVGYKLKDTVFIDAYSRKVGIEGREGDVIVEGPEALNDISLSISSKISQSYSNLAFLTFSSLLSNNPLERSLKFLQVIEGRIKKAKGVLLLPIDRGLHKSEELAKVLHFIDEVYYIKRKKRELYLEGGKLIFPVKFEVLESGINLL